MSRPLNVLMIEDSEYDAELVLEELRRGDFEPSAVRVDTPEAMLAALQDRQWDLILSDYTMPRFSGPEALSMLKQHALDVPFIMISGTVGEDIAVASLKAGASDFLVKGQLLRLLPAISRELQDAKERLARRQAERDLEKSHAILAHYTQKLEQSNKELEHFATIASHDLQSPLRKVQMFSNHLQSVTQGQLSPEAAEDIVRIQRAVQKMQEMIQDLLAFSRVNRKGKPFAPVAIAPLIQETVRDQEDVIQTLGARVEVDIPDPSLQPEIDALQIQALLCNLIENALKFSQEGVAPHIRIHGAKLATEDSYRITVEDNGIGFKAEFAERIFEVFERLNGVSQYPGTGMGLAICKKIVERHQGAIKAESTPGEGSRFIITLPMRQPVGPDPAIAPLNSG